LSCIIEDCIGVTRTAAMEFTMIKHRDDKTPELPGGRAAERLKMFEQARRPEVSEDPKSKTPPIRKRRPKKGRVSNEEQTRRKDQ
jgi:hypothetical protein